MTIRTPLLKNFGISRINPLGLIGSALKYLLRDEFDTAEAAPIGSPRTSEPGPGTLTIVQTDSNEFKVINGQLEVAGYTGAGFAKIAATGASVARVAGRVLVVDFQLANVGGYHLAGWSADATPQVGVTMFAAYLWAGDIYYRYGSGQQQIRTGVLSAGVQRRLAVVMRATGHHLLYHDGTNWQLEYVAADLSTTPMYPRLHHFAGGPAVGHKWDDFLVPNVTWTPTPIASDSFDRADSSSLGSTDGAGAEESGGDGLAWTEGGGADLSIASHAVVTDTNSARTYAYVDAGESDVVLQESGNLLTSDWILALLRFDDDDNYWTLEVSENANEIYLYERTGGGFTSRGTTSGTVTAGAYVLTGIASGTTITGYINGSMRVSYGLASVGSSRTKHGIYHYSTGTTIDSFVVWPRTITDFPNV